MLCYCALLPTTARCRAALKRWSLEAASRKKGSLVSAEFVERSSFRLAEYTPLIYLINYPDYNLTPKQNSRKIFCKLFPLAADPWIDPPKRKKLMKTVEFNNFPYVRQKHVAKHWECRKIIWDVK
jgi:hypothetical protein